MFIGLSRKKIKYYFLRTYRSVPSIIKSASRFKNNQVEKWKKLTDRRVGSTVLDIKGAFNFMFSRYETKYALDVCNSPFNVLPQKKTSTRAFRVMREVVIPT